MQAARNRRSGVSRLPGPPCTSAHRLDTMSRGPPRRPERSGGTCAAGNAPARRGPARGRSGGSRAPGTPADGSAPPPARAWHQPARPPRSVRDSHARARYWPRIPGRPPARPASAPVPGSARLRLSHPPGRSNWRAVINFSPGSQDRYWPNGTIMRADLTESYCMNEYSHPAGITLWFWGRPPCGAYVAWQPGSVRIRRGAGQRGSRAR
jgi:hypothetical protein